MSGLGEELADHLGGLRLGARHESVPGDEGHARAEVAQHLTELEADRARAEHGQARGRALQLEGRGGGQVAGLLEAGDGGDRGPAADREKDRPGAHGLTGDAHRVRVEELGVAPAQADPVLVQQVLVLIGPEALDEGPLAALGGAHPLGVAVGGEPVHEQGLRGDAAHVDAGAADGSALDHQHAATEVARTDGAREGPAARADHEEVDVEVAAHPIIDRVDLAHVHGATVAGHPVDVRLVSPHPELLLAVAGAPNRLGRPPVVPFICFNVSS